MNMVIKWRVSYSIFIGHLWAEMPLFSCIFLSANCQCGPTGSNFFPIVCNSLLSLVIGHSNYPDLANKSPFKLPPYDIPLSFKQFLILWQHIMFYTHTFLVPILKLAISVRKAWFLLMRNVLEINICMCIHRWDVTAPRSLQNKAREYIYAYGHIHISTHTLETYGSTPIPTIPMHCHLVFQMCLLFVKINFSLWR